MRRLTTLMLACCALGLGYGGAALAAFMLDMSLTAPERKKRRIPLIVLDKIVVDEVIENSSLVFVPSTSS